MPDDKERRKLDKTRININDPKEVHNWCKSLGCSVLQLKTAVRAVGTSAEKVRKYLEKHA